MIYYNRAFVCCDLRLNLNEVKPNHRKSTLQSSQSRDERERPVQSADSLSMSYVSCSELTSTPESGTPSHTPLAQELSSGKQSTRRRETIGCKSPVVYNSLRKVSTMLRTISDIPLSIK